MFWTGFLVGAITAFIMIGVGELVATIVRARRLDRELKGIWGKGN